MTKTGCEGAGVETRQWPPPMARRGPQKSEVHAASLGALEVGLRRVALRLAPRPRSEGLSLRFILRQYGSNARGREAVLPSEAMFDLSLLGPERIRPLKRSEYDRLIELGVIIEDTREGTSWRWQ